MYVCRYERIAVYVSFVCIHRARSGDAYPPIHVNPVRVRRWRPTRTATPPSLSQSSPVVLATQIEEIYVHRIRSGVRPAPQRDTGQSRWGTPGPSGAE